MWFLCLSHQARRGFRTKTFLKVSQLAYSEYVTVWINGFGPKKLSCVLHVAMSVKSLSSDYGTLRTGDIEDKKIYIRHWAQKMTHWGHVSKFLLYSSHRIPKYFRPLTVLIPNCIYMCDIIHPLVRYHGRSRRSPAPPSGAVRRAVRGR